MDRDMGSETTTDALLGGKVQLIQRRHGYRVAIDPVLLAAFVPARSGQRVLDFGTGVGAAALCLARRVPGLDLTGVEQDDTLAALAQANVELNKLDIWIAADDITRLDVTGFHHVMANPPFLSDRQGDPRRPGSAPAANREGEARLADWIAAAHRVLAPGGVLTMIHRADQLDEILSLLSDGFGGAIVFPLWPKAGTPAKRLLVRAAKASKTPMVLSAGLVLHGPDGRYTPDAERILRDGEALTP